MNVPACNKRRPKRNWRLLPTGLLLSILAAKGQVASPILDWQQLLADPDPAALAELAGQYEHAIGYRRDYGRARQLYCAAARLGYLPARDASPGCMPMAWAHPGIPTWLPPGWRLLPPTAI